MCENPLLMLLKSQSDVDDGGILCVVYYTYGVGVRVEPIENIITNICFEF